MSSPLGILIIEKLGNIKTLNVKDYKEEELYKKCGFKKDTNFTKQVEWGVKLNKVKYLVYVFGKQEGKANTENKYDFPPPLDSTLLFGNCAVVCNKVDKDNVELIDLTIEMWEKIYEKLFGGFEDLSSTANEDENEKDELTNVPEKYKTQTGYLKDGFVVDDSELISETGGTSLSDEESFSDDEEDSNNFIMEDDLELEAIGSELSEDEYIE